jgi:purine-binding chemotaxis protein CheW
MHTARSEVQAVAAVVDRGTGRIEGRSAGSPPAAPGSRQYLTFALGSESYAAAIDAIREIIEVPPLTAVPMTPSFVRGVINLRGAVVPVIDLANRFAIGDTPIARRTCVVVVEVAAEEGTQVLGVLVDAVHEVLDIAAGDVEPAPALGTRIHPEFIAGMARVAGRLMVVLDLGRVLAQGELASLVAGHRRS